MNDELRANENESVVVTGRRLEVDRSRANGQSILISPLEASRFDTLVHLRRESSVLAPESGRISPSGFVVPSIRGQDVKLTEVYLEDTLLQDPYSGLPLIEDIDLRAFGTLEIHQGLPPPEVPGLNPIGTLRYRFRNTSKNQFKAGLQSGSIFGFSQWTLGAFHHKGENNGTDARMYARHHQTSGRFPFYSDRSTPYNSGDDTIEVRANNDQLSQQAVPWLRYHNGPYAVEAMGWLYDAKRGLPSMSVAVPSEAREAAEGYLGNIRLSRDFAGVGAGPAFNVSLHATQNLDQRGVLDPSQRFLSSAKSSEMRVRSKRVGLNIVSKKGKTDTFAAFEAGQTSVQSQLDSRKSDALDRHAHTNSLGIRLYPWPLFAVEAKATQRIHRDHLGAAAASITLPEEDQNAGRQRAATAMGASFSFANATQGVYGQIATAQRLPSLIEEFGNGSNIRPNSRLNPEATRHQEFGLFVQEHESLWRGSLVVYKDKTADKIIFIPIMANATKAANIRSTVVRGIDLRTELKFADLSFFASMSRLYPYDETRAPRRYLPGIPGQVYVLEAEGRLQGITGRWLARYKDKVYRDLANSIQIPGIWIHDASLDSSFSLQKIDFQLGLSLRNIFNLMSMPIEAPDTLSNKGRTAYADYSGAPLPGRQWQLALTLTL